MGSRDADREWRGLLGFAGFSGLAVEKGFSGSRGFEGVVVFVGDAEAVGDEDDEEARSNRIMSWPTRDVFNYH